MYCRNCGEKLKKDDNFCSKCGEGKNNVIKTKSNYERVSNSFGIACFIVAFFFNIVCIPLGIISIVYYFKNKKITNKGCSGLVFSIVGMVVGIALFSLFMFVMSFMMDLLNNDIESGKVRDRYEYKYEYSSGNLLNLSVDAWQDKIKQDRKVVTVFMNGDSSCRHYKHILNELVRDEGIDVVLFDVSSLSMDDKSKLFSTFSDLKFTTYPYTIITKNGKIVNEVGGVVSEDVLDNMLDNLGDSL